MLKQENLQLKSANESNVMNQQYNLNMLFRHPKSEQLLGRNLN